MTDNEREIAIIRSIVTSITNRGFAPSQREIAAELGLASPGSTNLYLKVMEAKGLVTLTPGIPRATAVTATGLKALTVEV